MKAQLQVLNHSSAIVTSSELPTFEFSLVFFISQARISFLGKGQLDCDTVDNQRRHGAKVATFGSFDL